MAEHLRPETLEQVVDAIRWAVAEDQPLDVRGLGSKQTLGRATNVATCLDLSRLAGLTLYFLTQLPIHDATNGSKMYRKSFLDSITLESARGWEIALEITVKAHAAGKSMTEIPVIQQARTKGVSKFKMLKWLPRYLRWYWFAITHSF